MQQGDRKVILFADDLANSEIELPLLDSDALMVRGDELSIVRIDDSTRRVNGVLIAYEITVRG